MCIRDSCNTNQYLYYNIVKKHNKIEDSGRALREELNLSLIHISLADDSAKPYT